MPRLGLGADDFARLLTNLSPTGDAWSTDPASVQQQVWLALSPTYADLNTRANFLLTDVFPGQTIELLEEWEKSLGLPDRCSPLAATIEQRRRSVVAKLIAVGGQSVPFFTALAAAFGVAVTIDQFAPFRVDANDADDPCDDDREALVWVVNVPYQLDQTHFEADDPADDALDTYAFDELFCRMRAIAPTNTRMVFAYPQDVSFLLGVDDQPLTGQDGQELVITADAPMPVNAPPLYPI